ncbi:ethanolamine ammonia-lyase reactivating factor EutA [Methylocystis sp. WRRC1]|uniref:ethanolamine ammonia-lyase reactivating factor EutA n=1 Tax=Methylocystis sp. WRRC1 TaxID=1732014 RepID=UPI001D142E26|nr:ethanolamine ammonia-lyase reactivating factor EutA [Methylocystis sp. WRRC1]MCC3246254.1 ethanolamine ammonia-lyase reactivating factor EutA [Methylocystis sp. WRRC1]
MVARVGLNQVKLVGLDFGSTTTSFLALQAEISGNCVTGRMALRNPRAIYRPDPIFTPLNQQKLDLEAIRSRVLSWLTEAGTAREDIFAGGAIVTGLAAERENADALRATVIDLLGDAVVATADDPRLESWLAFMGAGSAVSRAHPEQPILNMDIGGGTTNPALGLAGDVKAVGCYFIGARHFEFEPGRYRLKNFSRFGAAMLENFGFEHSVGSDLSSKAVARLTKYLTDALVAIVEQDHEFFDNPLGRLIAPAPCVYDASIAPAVTFSGGVGELVYAISAGEASPATTAYGDLGVNLAQAIVADKRLAADIQRFVPEHRGRATVQGLTYNNTEISGTTLFLGAAALPLPDLPIVASLSSRVDARTLTRALKLAGGSRRGVCIQLAWDETSPCYGDVKKLGLTISEALNEASLPSDAPLVILTNANVGKALGNYATAWKSSARRLIVIDEIPTRKAQFVNLGAMRSGVVPVSFYGMN